MKYRDSMIAYNPGGLIVVGPHPDRTGWSDQYERTVGAVAVPGSGVGRR